MKPRRWRTSFALLLMLTLIVPLLAACGGPGQVATPTSAPATAAEATAVPVTEPTTAPETATEAVPEATEAPSSEATTAPEATEAPSAEATTAPEATEGEASGDTSPAGNILRINWAEPDTADPQKASFVNEIAIIMANYLPLMTFDAKTLKPVPGAAESVQTSADGQTFTFKLRPNQKYSDGEPLTASNFEYAWKRLCDPSTAGDYATIAYPVVGCQEYFEAFTTGGLTMTDQAKLQELRDGVGVKALDDDTFEIKLKEPAPYFLNVAALWVGAPTREDLVEKGGDSWWSDPANFIGNGPFQLTEWEHNSRMHFDRNENYVLTDRKPTFEAMEGPMITDSSVAFEAYKSGELDMSGVAAEDLANVQADPDLNKQLIDVPGTCTFYLGFHNKVAPFDNKEVRQAFALAIDRDAWVRDILKGEGKPTLTFIPPGFPGYDADEKLWSYDPEAAKAKLDATGFDKSTEIKLSYAASARNKARYEYLAAQFQKVLGVKITLDPVEPTAYTGLFKEGSTPPPMFILGWCADYPDPQDWVSIVWQTGGIAAGRVAYSNPQLDEMTKKADGMPIDSPERAQLYKDAQHMLIEDTPAAMFWNDGGKTLIKPWVTGVHPAALDYSFPGFLDMASIKINGQ